jgi:hypothetical protein
MLCRQIPAPWKFNEIDNCPEMGSLTARTRQFYIKVAGVVSRR